MASKVMNTLISMLKVCVHLIHEGSMFLELCHDLLSGTLSENQKHCHSHSNEF